MRSQSRDRAAALRSRLKSEQPPPQAAVLMSLTAEQQLSYVESARRELLCLVDEHNNVIGSVARELMRRDRLWHRSTFIFVQSSEGNFYVQVHRSQLLQQ
jgi:hypothetical protein